MFGVKPKRKRANKKPSESKRYPPRSTATSKEPPSYGKSVLYSTNIASSSLAQLPSHVVSKGNQLSNFVPPPATTMKFQETLPGSAPRAQQRSLRSNALVTQPLVESVPTPYHILHRPGGSSDDIAHNALTQLISSRFDSVINSIDGETFAGDERDLIIDEELSPGLRGGFLSKGHWPSKTANRTISSTLVSTNYFAKANLYTNSRLPPNLPPLQLYLPSYPLLCLAAQYSQRAYIRPTGSEREAFVNADWRMGTKAMMIKSVPVDHMNCIVFAIRGSQTFMDWAVNLNSAPVSPVDFLNDPGNLCHSGFLSVARKMIKPVAARLRSLLEENPNRSSCSLLMTGHSAGGAVASLLYAHMLTEHVRSELNILVGCFKRIHCLTFGAPPVSLLPLTKPTTLRYKKSLFMSFINEGDPVPRADPAYVRSLLRLYVSPAPHSGCAINLPTLTPCKRFTKHKRSDSAPSITSKDFVWEVPPGTLSNAGRLVLLRGNTGTEAVAGRDESVKAEITCDQELRGVVFGDPLMHMMTVYARRIEVLATRAVTGRMWDL